MTIPINPNQGTLWPNDFQGCTIIGQYIDSAGHAIAGTVTFTMTPSAVLSASHNQVIVPKVYTVTLDINGSFSVTLPATDDPDSNPVDWTYAVSENFSGGRKYNIYAPQNQVVNLVDIVPVPSTQGSPIVRGPAGPAGGVQFVNGKTGAVVNLTPADVGADVSGAAAAATATALQKANNLSDLADDATAQFNLGLGTIATKNTADYLAAAMLDAMCPIGILHAWSGTGVPSSSTPEWKLCDGTAISRTTYSALFTLLGTLYGTGNGTTTFNLPDLRGRMPAGAGAGAVGAVGFTNSLTGYKHTHNMGGAYAMVTINNNQIMLRRMSAANPNSYSSNNAIIATADNPNVSPNLNGTQIGGNTDLDGTISPYLALNFIIRAR